MQMIEPIRNSATLEAKEPAGTLKTVPLEAWTIAAIAQATPMPRKTLTAFDPVTFPIEESAVLSWIAAIFDAKVSENK